MIRELLTKIRQYLCFHDFTTDFKERGCVDKAMVAKIGFWKAWVQDNRMYCKKCGHVPEVTIEFLKRCEQIDKEIDKDETEEQKLISSFINEILNEILTPPRIK